MPQITPALVEKYIAWRKDDKHNNTADLDSLPDMVDTLSSRTRVPAGKEQKALVVLDADIATEDNLKKKGLQLSVCEPSAPDRL